MPQHIFQTLNAKLVKEREELEHALNEAYNNKPTKIDYEEKIIKQDSIKSINRDSASAEDIQLLEYASSKVTYELSYLMVLFTKNKLGNVKDILNNMANNDNNVVKPDNSEDVPVVDENVDNSLEMSTPSE